MKEVTEKEFFNVIGKLNVTCTPKGEYPYRTDFCYRNGDRVGYIQDIDIIGLPISKYYICEEKLNN